MIKQLKVNFVGASCARDELLATQIKKILRAATSGSTAVLAETAEEPHAQFSFSSNATFDFGAQSSGGKFNFKNQPSFLDVLIAGRSVPAAASEKIKTLDADDKTWIIVAQDGKSNGVQQCVEESQLVSDLTVLDKVSHALFMSTDGTPLATTKLCVLHGCMPFSCGVDSMAADSSWLLPCAGVDDFLFKADAISKEGTTRAFMTHVAPHVFTADRLTARSFRSLVASHLKLNHGSDFGVGNLSLADSRLLKIK